MATTLSDASRPVAAAAAVQPKAATRLLFVDNVRVFLTILVILHHTMIIYAGSGSWGLYQEGRQDLITGVIGTWFCAINQAYFMELFLLISAYFVPGSYDRKGAGRFIKDRLVRLGIPLLIYSWIINPLSYYVIRGLVAHQSLPWTRYLPGNEFEGVIGAGPLWFVEVLLILSLVYALLRCLFRPNPPTPPVQTDAPFPSSAAIVVFAVLLAVVSFLVRRVVPIDWVFPPLNLQFPFFASYIALFVVGLVAYRRSWLLGLPEATGRRWLRIAIVIMLLFLPLAVAGGGPESVQPFKGGWHWQALALALWQSFLCMGMCIGLTYFFRRHLDHQGRVLKFLSPNAYTAYIIHAQVITATALVLQAVPLYPLLKFVLVALVAVPATFGLSSLIRKLPYMDRVLCWPGAGPRLHYISGNSLRNRRTTCSSATSPMSCWPPCSRPPDCWRHAAYR